MNFFMVLGVIVWIMIAIWLVRLGMGFLSKDQNCLMVPDGDRQGQRRTADGGR